MKPIVIIASAVALSLAAIAIAETTTKVVGKVTDAATGKPISGAQVSIIELRASASTDSNGRYAIPDVPIGTGQKRYGFTVERQGYASSVKDIVYVGEFGTTDFALEPARAELPNDAQSSLAIPDSAQLQIIKFQDGTTSMGRITRVDSATVVFKTSFGEMTVARDKIEEVRTVASASVVEGKYWFPNPNATRLFFGPTAHMLKQGKGYFSDIYVFFPSVTYGITGNITMGGGISLFPTGSMEDQIVFFTPKVGFKPSPDFGLAAGALIVRAPTYDSDNKHATAGIVYGVGTYGDLDRSITAGLGYGYAGNEMADKPMVMMGGEYRLSRRVAFVTENWIFPGLDQPLVSAGIRFFGEGMCCDLALANVVGRDAIAPGIPYVDFVINF